MDIKCQNERCITFNERHLFLAILCNSQLFRPELLPVFHFFPQRREVNWNAQVGPTGHGRHDNVAEQKLLHIPSLLDSGHPNLLQLFRREFRALGGKSQYRSSNKLARHREKLTAGDICQHEKALSISFEVIVVTACKRIHNFHERRERHTIVVSPRSFSRTSFQAATGMTPSLTLMMI